jgi:16S rRNA processing protein RimM
VSGAVKNPAREGSITPVPADLVAVAHVTGSYGVEGWVRIRPYSDEASSLFVARVWWLDREGLRSVRVLDVRPHGGELLAHMAEIRSREEAEALRGALVHVSRASFPVLDENEFYWVDLIGLQVINRRGVLLGAVHALMDNPAHPILRVRLPDAAGECLIPFVAPFIEQVDLPKKRIVVDWEADY